MKKTNPFILIPLLLIILTLAYLSLKYPQTQLQNSAIYFAGHILHPHAKLNKYIIGFLPYWRIDDAKYSRLDLLSEVNYFSLTPDRNGNIIKINGNETEPGWREWEKQSLKDLQTKTHINDAKFTFTLTSLDNSTIESILDSSGAQTTLTNEIIEQIKTRNLDGVNIDFEYSGDADTSYRDKFTGFIQKLSSELHKQTPDAQLSLSIMPLAGRSNDLFDFPKLVPLIDRFIGMSYDYYGVNADIAGPVAPMKGFNEGRFFFDVTTTYEDYRKVIPKEKIIMGMPYYGWDRTVVDGKAIMSQTFPDSDEKNYSAILSYARMRENKDLKPTQCKWDELAAETWCWYTDKKGIDHQVWYEDNKSLGIKYDFTNKQKLGGIGIWVLGYDKDYPDLWELIHTHFSK